MKYITLNYPNAKENSKTLLTGIRSENDVYIITGFYEEGDITISFVYKGTLKDIKSNKGKFYPLKFQDKPTYLYGPNIECDKYTIVGNYTNGNSSYGCLYEGDLYNSGKWTTLIPAFVETITNTICHSNMGGYVVGNYETAEDPNRSKAFIYEISTGVYYRIPMLSMFKNEVSISAYGIWKNKKNNYTICGGYIFSDREGSDRKEGKAYTVDWINKEFTNWKEYSNSGLDTHFDGIWGHGSCYHLTGDSLSIDNIGFFCKVKNDKVKYTDLSYPNSKTTSGNSVFGNTVVGVYTTSSSSQVNGYVAIV